MILYINGADIKSLVLGLLKETWVLERFDLAPEAHLTTLDDYLKRHELKLDSLTGIVAVIGPGSPTALRSSLSIVNSLMFARSLPCLPLEKQLEDDDLTVLSELDLAAISLPGPDGTGQISPIYLHPPRITTSTRDNLKRIK